MSLSVSNNLLICVDRILSTLLLKKTCCIKNFCLDGILHSEVGLQCVYLFIACLQTVKYKLQPANQHQDHTVQSTVSCTKLQAEVFGITGNLFYFGENLSEPGKTPAVVQKQDFLSHLTAIILAQKLLAY